MNERSYPDLKSSLSAAKEAKMVAEGILQRAVIAKRIDNNEMSHDEATGEVLNEILELAGRRQIAVVDDE